MLPVVAGTVLLLDAIVIFFWAGISQNLAPQGAALTAETVLVFKWVLEYASHTWPGWHLQEGRRWKIFSVFCAALAGHTLLSWWLLAQASIARTGSPGLLTFGLAVIALIELTIIFLALHFVDSLRRSDSGTAAG